MHLLLSTTVGATMACVGQASIQAVHVPQWSVLCPSGVNSKSSINSPIKKKLPSFLLSNRLCFPIQEFYQLTCSTTPRSKQSKAELRRSSRCLCLSPQAQLPHQHHGQHQPLEYSTYDSSTVLLNSPYLNLLET